MGFGKETSEEEAKKEEKKKKLFGFFWVFGGGAEWCDFFGRFLGGLDAWGNYSKVYIKERSLPFYLFVLFSFL